jgi:hypothetical protein
MTGDNTKSYLQKWRWRYISQRCLEATLLGLAAMFLALSLSRMAGFDGRLSIFVGTGLALAVATARFFYLRLHRLSDTAIAHYVNRHYPDVGESADLLLKGDDVLPLLAQLQKARVAPTLEFLRVRFPHKLVPATGLLAVCLLLSVSTRWWPPAEISPAHPSRSEKSAGPEQRDEPATVSRVAITITPPRYTGLAPFAATGDLAAPENSRVLWRIDFSGPATARLIFSGKDTVTLAGTGGTYSTSRVVNESGFYQLQWRNEGQPWHIGDYHKMEMLRDQAPRITVENLAPFTEFRFDKNMVINLKALLTDDYGLKSAQIVATVTKGSGEAVKFREEKLAFDHPQRVEGKSAPARRRIDLRALGLDPGDELYFYITVEDNKLPVANHTRTETFFVSVLDTAAEETVADAGMAVDLMPEYFRSQRQIIIDSEKLLEEQKQKKVSPANFNDRSNSLGYDERVLRLRYSQFMGEEVETSEANEAAEQVSDNKAEDIAREYGHSHDTENEVNQVPEKSGTALEQSIRAKLKAAVNMMWDAELHLRLNDPAQSLPFQYKILKLLKEISNDSRMYVRRSGFDPPPLKEDKRLEGDLADLKTTTVSHDAEHVSMYPRIRRALQLLGEVLSSDTIMLRASQQQLLRQAGQELSAAAIEQPGLYLHSLSLLNAVTQPEIKAADLKSSLQTLQATFWKLIPSEVISPSARVQSLHTLDQRFIKQLGGEKKHE